MIVVLACRRRASFEHLGVKRAAFGDERHRTNYRHGAPLGGRRWRQHLDGNAAQGTSAPRITTYRRRATWPSACHLILVDCLSVSERQRTRHGLSANSPRTVAALLPGPRTSWTSRAPRRHACFALSGTHSRAPCFWLCRLARLFHISGAFLVIALPLGIDLLGRHAGDVY